MMNDNYDEFEGFDEEEYYVNDDNFVPSFVQGSPVKELYFFGGTYKISTVSQMFGDDNDMHFACIVEPTELILKEKNPKSIIDVYEYFENSFFLEFLVTVLCNSGIIGLNKCKRIIKCNQNDAQIFVTAVINREQKFCRIEDDIESESECDDMIYIDEKPIMRHWQYFYTVTQAIKYTIVKYTAFNNCMDWASDSIDWYNVYESLINPYILNMASIALKTNDLTDIYQYKEYMTFTIQFAIARTTEAFYCEINLLPKTVFGHSLTYNHHNGREIYLGVTTENDPERKEINSDEFRICAGSQNLNLLPLNVVNLKTIYDNGNLNLVLKEISTKSDILMNRFVMPRSQYSHVPLEDILCIDRVDIAHQNILRINSKYDCMFSYFLLLEPKELKISAIDLGSNTRIYGLCSFVFKDNIPYNELVYTMKENKDDSLLPPDFYNEILDVYQLSNNSEFILTPIRALPKYREFMLSIILPETKETESQSNIINKKENSNQKRKLFGFRKKGD